MSINVSSSASLALLLTPSTSGTFALLASSSPSWIIDSGASSHMTETSSLLPSYHPNPSHPPVTIADGQPCLLQDSGTTRVTPSLSLHQILHVPGFLLNLLSISAITHALPYAATFFPFHCIFKDLYAKQRIGLGRENGWGIYELVADEPLSGLQALFVTSTATSSLLWHRRLGHPYFDKLKKTLPWLSLTQFVCESCQLGKHHRSSYSSRDGIPSSTPFDLLQCDVWGPSCTPSISSHHYYIVFVNNYTRVSFVYLLYDCFEVVTTVTHFITEVVTQYSTMSKILCTDNALEFFQTSLCTFCVDRGIIHQTTCPHTSQQNDVAERKHHQLLDITRTLLIEMHVPSYLWSNALIPIAKIGSHLLPLVALFPFIVSYPPRPSSPFLLELDVSLLSKITLLPSLNSALMLSKACLLATLRHKRVTGCTFLTPSLYDFCRCYFHEDSPFFSPSSLSPTPSTTSPPRGFPPLVVISNPRPSVSPPPLSLSLSSLLLSYFLGSACLKYFRYRSLIPQLHRHLTILSSHSPSPSK